MEITIAIPVYNVEPYVEKCLLSVLEQDFSQPYEVLVIDDCGTDQSMAIVQQLAVNHPNGNRIRIIHHPERKGLGETRNTAIDQSSQSHYLLFVDSDDWLAPDALTLLYNQAICHQADVVAGSTDAIETGVQQPRYRLTDSVSRQPHAGICMHTNDIFMNIEMWNKLFSTHFLQQHQLHTVHPYIEDSVFDFEMRVKAQTIVTISQVTLYYNIRPGSILNHLKATQVADETLLIYCDIIKRIQQSIRSNYQMVNGIYDFYCLRLAYTFHAIGQLQLSDKQQASFVSQINGFSTFIPNMHLLRLGINRLAYLSMKIKGQQWQRFDHLYKHRYDRSIRVAAKILELL